VVAGHGLAALDGLAIGSGNVWFAYQYTGGVTEIPVTSGTVLANRTDADGRYSFGQRIVMISTGANIYVATPGYQSHGDQVLGHNRKAELVRVQHQRPLPLQPVIGVRGLGRKTLGGQAIRCELQDPRRR
jgi:hypothetical protein